MLVHDPSVQHGNLAACNRQLFRMESRIYLAITRRCTLTSVGPKNMTANQRVPLLKSRRSMQQNYRQLGLFSFFFHFKNSTRFYFVAELPIGMIGHEYNA